MKLKDLLEYGNVPDSGARYMNPDVARRRARLNSRRDTGYGTGLEGKRPKAGDPAYMKAYRRGREDRLYYKKHGSSRHFGEAIEYDRLTDKDLSEIRAVRMGHQDEVGEEVFEKLFAMWMHEMPYGTAKARTGDPYQWIGNKIARMSEREFHDLIATHASGHSSR